MRADDLKEQVMDFIDNLMRDQPAYVYKAVLEDVASDIDLRLDALAEDFNHDDSVFDD